jgi:hypothetical protein
MFRAKNLSFWMTFQANKLSFCLKFQAKTFSFGRLIGPKIYHFANMRLFPKFHKSFSSPNDDIISLQIIIFFGDTYFIAH